VTLRRRLALTTAAIVGATVVLAAGLCYLAVRSNLRGQVDDNATPTAARFDHALDQAGAREITLKGNGNDVARVVVLPDGTGYLRNDHLAPLDQRRTYQLWALMGDPTHPTAISAGVLGNDPKVAAFNVKAPVVAFALTDEQAGGVVSSQNQPVAVGTVPA